MRSTGATNPLVSRPTSAEARVAPLSRQNPRQQPSEVVRISETARRLQSPSSSRSSSSDVGTDSSTTDKYKKRKAFKAPAAPLYGVNLDAHLQGRGNPAPLDSQSIPPNANAYCYYTATFAPPGHLTGGPSVPLLSSSQVVIADAPQRTRGLGQQSTVMSEHTVQLKDASPTKRGLTGVPRQRAFPLAQQRVAWKDEHDEADLDGERGGSTFEEEEEDGVNDSNGIRHDDTGNSEIRAQQQRLGRLRWVHENAVRLRSGEMDRDRGVCGVPRRGRKCCLVVMCVGVAVVVLALALGLGLGLGLRSRQHSDLGGQGGGGDGAGDSSGPPTNGGGGSTTDVPLFTDSSGGASAGMGDVIDFRPDPFAYYAVDPWLLSFGTDNAMLSIFWATDATRILDARVTARRNYSLRFYPAVADACSGAAAQSLTMPRCPHDCPVRRAMKAQQQQRPQKQLASPTTEVPTRVLSTDNIKAHMEWVVEKSLSAPAAANAPPSFPFPTNFTPFLAKADTRGPNVKTLTWPTEGADAFVAWRGQRLHNQLQAVLHGHNKVHICTHRIANHTSMTRTPTDADLYEQVGELYQNGWYASELDAEMLYVATNSTDGDTGGHFDDRVPLRISNTSDPVSNSTTFRSAASPSSVVKEYALEDRAYLRVWVRTATSTNAESPLLFEDFYNLTMHNDSASITLSAAATEHSLFSVLLLSCRCPSSGERLHRLVSVDALTLAFREYHECVLATARYGLRPQELQPSPDATNQTSSGEALQGSGAEDPLVRYQIFRDYDVPVVFLGIGPSVSRAAGEATAAMQGVKSRLLWCARRRGLAAYQAAEGLAARHSTFRITNATASEHQNDKDGCDAFERY